MSTTGSEVPAAGGGTELSQPPAENVQEGGTAPKTGESRLAAEAASFNSHWHRRPANRTITLVVHAVLLAFGVFLVVNSYNRWSEAQPVAGGKTTSGSVVAVALGQSCGRYSCSPTWTPTIRFMTTDGVAHTFVGPESNSQLSDGDSVRVSYDPANPAVAHDVSAGTGSSLVELGLGVFLLVFGLGSFIVGLEVVHRRTGLVPAREGKGWVGHQHLHSNTGVLAIVSGVVAIAVVVYFVL